MGFFVTGFYNMGKSIIYTLGMGLVENSMLQCSGIACLSPQPSSLINELSMDRRDSNDFYSIQTVCLFSNSSCSTTDPILIQV